MKTTLPEGYRIKEHSQNKWICFAIVNCKNGESIGHIMIKEVSRNQFFVGSAGAPKGYGPMLYDIAMKYASERGHYLISNREANYQHGIWGKTSTDACRVWEFYENHRPDVSKNENGFYMEKYWKPICNNTVIGVLY